MAGLFAGEANFCPKCGRILPLAELYDSIKCRTCSYEQKISRNSGPEEAEYSCVLITEASHNIRSHEKPSKGPYVERVCQKCGHDKMTYYTQQTRSIDEGQTVFYHCPQCMAQETEHS